eukprot:scaffold39454_cov270-Isochrysis_galbana.AAC.1
MRCSGCRATFVMTVLLDAVLAQDPSGRRGCRTGVCRWRPSQEAEGPMCRRSASMVPAIEGREVSNMTS